MESDARHTTETQALLSNGTARNRERSVAAREDVEASSFTGDKHDSTGERLPYSDYTTIDWMQELVKHQDHRGRILSQTRIRHRLWIKVEAASGWIAAAVIGSLTAGVAFLVDIAVVTVSDWKTGYCRTNPFFNRESCCAGTLKGTTFQSNNDTCSEFHLWSTSYASSYAIYVAFALLFGSLSGGVTLLTKSALPAITPRNTQSDPIASGKVMYMASGSGIPEIKTILSGFVIPHFLDFKVLVVKAVGSVFAVATGMCLGKEGPFVHISACTGHLVASRFSKYRNNSRKMREILSVACAAGLTVAFGAPIGGVLFSYEEISTYFPRKVLWHASVCSLFAAMTLKALNPTGTGKLVLFETNYAASYKAEHYFVFVLLGIAGGIFGGAFCRLNFFWSRWFRSFHVITAYPVFEVALIVLATALLQYPNLLIREPGDIVMKQLLVDCSSEATDDQWVCQQEARTDAQWPFVGWLVYGALAKLVLMVVTFGIKVPSGIIVPALDAGALVGRLVGQWIPSVSPGIFAIVGAGAFLAGVSRMTLSLVVIMFELTGELEHIVPHMIAIFVAKWIADALSKEGVYDLAQSVLGHPFLDADQALSLVQANPALVEDLIPPAQTMREIVVHVPASNQVPRRLLEEKLYQLERRGLMDAGLALVQNDNVLQGYIGEAELRFGLQTMGCSYANDVPVQLLLPRVEEYHFDVLDLSPFVDRTVFTVSAVAPMEYCVEMFGKLGLRHLMVLEEGTGKLVGVIIKKRLVAYLDALKQKPQNGRSLERR